MKQTNVHLKLGNERQFSVDGEHVQRLEMYGIECERTLYMPQKYNLDNYPKYFYIHIGREANRIQDNGRSLFDAMTKDSFLDEVYFEFEGYGCKIVEGYTFIQNDGSDLDHNAYQYSRIDSYGDLHVVINESFSEEKMDEKIGRL